RLADQLIERGEVQEAELLLIRDRLQADPRVAAAATVRLLWLWDQLGLNTLAANLLSELEERFGDVSLPASLRATRLTSPARQKQTPGVARAEVPLTGRAFVAAFPHDGQTWQAFTRRQRPSWDVRRVVISEDRTHAGQSPLIESYDQFRRRFQTPSGMAFHRFEKPLS